MTATKNFRVDSFVADLAIKAPCKVATNANLTLSGEQIVNGTQVNAGDRVLVKDQTDAKENGIYSVETSAWCRAGDFDGERDVARGTLVVVPASTGQDYFYQVSTADPITIGTSDIDFALRNAPNVRYPLTGAEVTEGLTESSIDDSYPEGTTIRYGTGDAALQTASAVVGVNGKVIVSPGNYEKVNLIDNDRTYVVDQSVIFTIPDNDISGVATSGTPALEVSANNVTVEGEIFCDGNKANQNTSGFAADERSAAFKVSGDDFIHNGTVNILNAFWDGFTIDGGDTAGQEVLRTIIGTIKVKDPENRSGTFWGAIGFDVGSIDVNSETALNGDHRIRVGTNGSATSVSKGRIGYIHAPGQLVVIEENTELLQLADVQAASLKSELANNVQGGRVDVRDLDDTANLSFGVIGGSNISFDNVSVSDHGGSAAVAVSFENDFTDVRIGRLRVKDSVNTAGGARVRAGVGLHVGLGSFEGNADFGLHVDESGAWTQSDFRFDVILASGNTGTDVNFEDGIDRATFGYIDRQAGATYAGIASQTEDINVFGLTDATPSVLGGRIFRTADTTTITDFDDGVGGQEIIVHVDHAVTFDVTGTNLTGNGGVDIVAAAGDMIKAYTQDGTTWILEWLNAA